MPEMNYNYEYPPADADGISKVAIHFPDKNNLGTGMFTTSFLPKVLPPNKKEIGSVLNHPNLDFQIGVSVTRGFHVNVTLGDGIASTLSTFELPITTNRKQHDITIVFADWVVETAKLDNVLMAVLDEDAPTLH